MIVVSIKETKHVTMKPESVSVVVNKVGIFHSVILIAVYISPTVNFAKNTLTTKTSLTLFVKLVNRATIKNFILDSANLVKTVTVDSATEPSALVTGVVKTVGMPKVNSIFVSYLVQTSVHGISVKGSGGNANRVVKWDITVPIV